MARTLSKLNAPAVKAATDLARFQTAPRAVTLPDPYRRRHRNFEPTCSPANRVALGQGRRHP